MPELTSDQISQKRSDASAFLSECSSNGMQMVSLDNFISNHFTLDGYTTVLPVKDYKDKNGTTQKAGTKSSLTLEQIRDVKLNGSCVDQKGEEWRIKPSNANNPEYWEFRPCFGHNLNGEREQMMIIDVDGIESNGDVNLQELFTGEYLPDDLFRSSFFLSRQKCLPHFIFYVTGLPDNVEIKNYVDCLNFGKGDILLNHAWERCDSEFFKVYQYENDLIKINWETVKTWIDPESENGKKLLGLKKVRTVKKQVVQEDQETESVTAVNNETLDNIKALVNAILQKKPDSFDDYQAWSQLGFVIFNETSGSSEGGDLFVELSQNFKSDSGKKHTPTTVCAQYFKAQPSRKKEDKLTIATLFKMLSDVDPDNKLLNVYIDQNITSGKLSISEIRRSKVYKDYRKEFEVNNFKLNNPVCYIEIDHDAERGQTLIFRDEKHLLLRFCDVKGMPKFKVKNDKKEMSFIGIWIDDEDKRKYSKIVFDPANKQMEAGETAQYNAFTGFPCDDNTTIPIKEQDSDFIKLMKHLFTSEKEFEYMKCWIAHIIQQPNKKTLVAPVLFSNAQGTGKNSFVDGIIALLGSTNCGQLTTIEDITKNFNAHLCNKLFIYGDEINANAKKVADLLKAVISRPEQNLEKKMVDPIKVKDYSNYIFTTNNENNFKIEIGDRRLYLVHCSEKSQTEISKASYAEIGDQSKVKQLFAFFKNYQQSEESIKQFGKFNVGSDRAMETEYKKNLMFEHRPAYIQMLFKCPNDFVGQKISSTEMHEKATQYAKAHYLSSNFTSQESAKNIKKLLEPFYKRGNTGVFYKFPETRTDLLKELYRVEEGYYRYIFQLDDGFVPEFKPEPLPKYRGHLTDTECESETD